MWDIVIGFFRDPIGTITGAYDYAKKNVTTIPKTKTKKKLTEENEKLIGLDDASYRYTSDLGANTGFTIAKFDTTTHGDRAVLQLQNASGASRVLGDNAIYGKPVIQIAGVGGFLWEYSDWDDIDTNGERFTEISNNFIISAAQCESIGDYAWKKLAPHKAYSFMISGAHTEIEPGSIWDLTINYVLNGNTIESIDTEIEVQSIKVDRNCKQIGMTSITGVIYDGAWSNTNSTRSRIVGAGKPQWMQSRTNTIVVASKDYAKGDADYYCTGTTDENIIELVINKANYINGAIIHLTNGNYSIADDLTLSSVDNIIIEGEGLNTIITFGSSSHGIRILSCNNITIKNCKLVCPSPGTQYGVYIYNSTNTIIDSIKIDSFPYGIMQSGASGTQIRNNNISGFIYEAINSISSLVDGNDLSTSFTNNVSMVHCAIYCSGGNNIITNNSIHDCSVTMSSGLAVWIIYTASGTTSNVISNNSIVNNEYILPGDYSGYVNGAIVLIDGSQDTISSNIIDSNIFDFSPDTESPACRMVLVASTDYSSIIGNIIQNNTAIDTSMTAVFISGDSSTISGNTMYNNITSGGLTSDGIYLPYIANVDNVVTGNRVSGHATNFNNNATRTINSGNSFV